MTNIEKPCQLLFIPPKYLHLTETKKIKWKNENLKTDYIISMMNELLNKYYMHKEDLIEREVTFNIWSVIFREKYGTKYNYYVDYLIETNFMIMVSDYYRAKKARTYKINTDDIIDMKRCKVNDTVLMKKLSPEHLKKSMLENNNSPIPIEIRIKLVSIR